MMKPFIVVAVAALLLVGVARADDMSNFYEFLETNLDELIITNTGPTAGTEFYALPDQLAPIVETVSDSSVIVLFDVQGDQDPQYYGEPTSATVTLAQCEGSTLPDGQTFTTIVQTVTSVSSTATNTVEFTSLPYSGCFTATFSLTNPQGTSPTSDAGMGYTLCVDPSAPTFTASASGEMVTLTITTPTTTGCDSFTDEYVCYICDDAGNNCVEDSTASNNVCTITPGDSDTHYYKVSVFSSDGDEITSTGIPVSAQAPAMEPSHLSFYDVCDISGDATCASNSVLNDDDHIAIVFPKVIDKSKALCSGAAYSGNNPYSGGCTISSNDLSTYLQVDVTATVTGAIGVDGRILFLIFSNVDEEDMTVECPCTVTITYGTNGITHLTENDEYLAFTSGEYAAFGSYASEDQRFFTSSCVPTIQESLAKDQTYLKGSSWDCLDVTTKNVYVTYTVSGKASTGAAVVDLSGQSTKCQSLNQIPYQLSNGISLRYPNNANGAATATITITEVGEDESSCQELDASVAFILGVKITARNSPPTISYGYGESSVSESVWTTFPVTIDDVDDPNRNKAFDCYVFAEYYSVEFKFPKTSGADVNEFGIFAYVYGTLAEVRNEFAELQVKAEVMATTENFPRSESILVACNDLGNGGDLTGDVEKYYNLQATCSATSKVTFIEAQRDGGCVYLYTDTPFAVNDDELDCSTISTTLSDRANDVQEECSVVYEEDENGYATAVVELCTNPGIFSEADSITINSFLNKCPGGEQGETNDVTTLTLSAVENSLDQEAFVFADTDVINTCTQATNVYLYCDYIGVTEFGTTYTYQWTASTTSVLTTGSVVTTNPQLVVPVSNFGTSALDVTFTCTITGKHASGDAFAVSDSTVVSQTGADGFDMDVPSELEYATDAQGSVWSFVTTCGTAPLTYTWTSSAAFPTEVDVNDAAIYWNAGSYSVGTTTFTVTATDGTTTQSRTVQVKFYTGKIVASIDQGNLATLYQAMDDPDDEGFEITTASSTNIAGFTTSFKCFKGRGKVTAQSKQCTQSLLTNAVKGKTTNMVFPVQGILPGAYRIQFSARDTSSSKTYTSVITLDVVSDDCDTDVTSEVTPNSVLARGYRAGEEWSVFLSKTAQTNAVDDTVYHNYFSVSKAIPTKYGTIAAEKFFVWTKTGASYADENGEFTEEQISAAQDKLTFEADSSYTNIAAFTIDHYVKFGFCSYQLGSFNVFKKKTPFGGYLEMGSTQAITNGGSTSMTLTANEFRFSGTSAKQLYYEFWWCDNTLNDCSEIPPPFAPWYPISDRKEQASITFGAGAKRLDITGHTAGQALKLQFAVYVCSEREDTDGYDTCKLNGDYAPKCDTSASTTVCVGTVTTDTPSDTTGQTQLEKMALSNPLSSTEACVKTSQIASQCSAQADCFTKTTAQFGKLMAGKNTARCVSRIGEISSSMALGDSTSAKCTGSTGLATVAYRALMTNKPTSGADAQRALSGLHQLASHAGINCGASSGRRLLATEEENMINATDSSRAGAQLIYQLQVTANSAATVGSSKLIYNEKGTSTTPSSVVELFLYGNKEVRARTLTATAHTATVTLRPGGAGSPSPTSVFVISSQSGVAPYKSKTPSTGPIISQGVEIHSYSTSATKLKTFGADTSPLVNMTFGSYDNTTAGIPVCVNWDETLKDWSTTGASTVSHSLKGDFNWVQCKISAPGLIAVSYLTQMDAPILTNITATGGCVVGLNGCGVAFCPIDESVTTTFLTFNGQKFGTSGASIPSVCQSAPELIGADKFRCKLKPGKAGTSVDVSVTTFGGTSNSCPLTYALAPTLLSVRAVGGCYESGPGLVGCPATGGLTLSISGLHFGTSMCQEVGGSVCQGLQHQGGWPTNTRQLICTLKANAAASVHTFGLKCIGGLTTTTTVEYAANQCQDGILNQDETQIDCGGALCGACASNPVLTRISVDNACVANSLDQTRADFCDIDGSNAVVHFFGSNLGRVGADAPSLCANRPRHNATNPTTHLTCTLKNGAAETCHKGSVCVNGNGGCTAIATLCYAYQPVLFSVTANGGCEVDPVTRGLRNCPGDGVGVVLTFIGAHFGVSGSTVPGVCAGPATHVGAFPENTRVLTCNMQGRPDSAARDVLARVKSIGGQSTLAVPVNFLRVPTCDDGIKNGNEAGIDCGGSCPVCVVPPVIESIISSAGCVVATSGLSVNFCSIWGYTDSKAVKLTFRGTGFGSAATITNICQAGTYTQTTSTEVICTLAAGEARKTIKGVLKIPGGASNEVSVTYGIPPVLTSISSSASSCQNYGGVTVVECDPDVQNVDITFTGQHFGEQNTGLSSTCCDSTVSITQPDFPAGARSFSCRLKKRPNLDKVNDFCLAKVKALAGESNAINIGYKSVARCDDLTQNGNETNVDCGGPCTQCNTNRPILNALFASSGCVRAEGGQALVFCPIDAVRLNVKLTLVGVHFGVTGNATVSACQSTPVVSQDGSQITCQLKNGVAEQSGSVYVKVNGWANGAASVGTSNSLTLSYALAPSLQSITGNAPCAPSGASIVNCPRNGGVTITLTGTGFGTSRANATGCGQNCVHFGTFPTNTRTLLCTLQAFSGLTDQNTVECGITAIGGVSNSFTVGYAAASGSVLDLFRENAGRIGASFVVFMSLLFVQGAFTRKSVDVPTDVSLTTV